MVNSRDINALRPDVAVNCRKLIELCAAEGFPVLVTSTVRDDAYQAELYKQGRTKPGSIVTNGKYPTFHWDEAGLAFDVCQNIKGKEYNDAAFWECVGRIGQQIGFSWGGSWRSFPDKPHFQWDGGGAYTGAMIRAKNFPPVMPLYEEDEMQLSALDFSALTDTQVEQLYNRIQKHLRAQNATMAQELQEAKDLGITDGTYPLAIPTREQVAVMVKRGVKTI